MADDIDRHTALNLEVRNAILDSIRSTVEKERTVHLGNVGSIAGALDKLAATDLYSKGPPDNNYSKNTKAMKFDDLIRPGEDIIRRP